MKIPYLVILCIYVYLCVIMIYYLLLLTTKEYFMFLAENGTIFLLFSFYHVEPLASL